MLQRDQSEQAEEQGAWKQSTPYRQEGQATPSTQGAHFHAECYRRGFSEER